MSGTVWVIEPCLLHGLFLTDHLLTLRTLLLPCIVLMEEKSNKDVPRPSSTLLFSFFPSSLGVNCGLISQTSLRLDSNTTHTDYDRPP